MQFDLSVIIKQYPQALASRAKLASLLHDLYPTEKYLTNITLAAYGVGAAERLRTAAVVDAMLTGALIRQLESDYGMTPESAEQSIQLWAAAYGKSIPNVSPAVAAPQKKQAAPRSQPKPVIVNGSASDYELEALEDGTYAIKKYRGFGEANTVIPTMIDGKQITVVGEAAFKDCKEIESLVVPEGIKELRQGAFAKCSNLASVSLPESLESLGTDKTFTRDGVFSGTSISSICIPKNVKIVGDDSFSLCSKLTDVIVQEGVVKIGKQAFFGCNLKHIEIPGSVLEIGDHAFGYCLKLEYIEIPSSVLEIGRNAFKDCSNMNTVILHEGLTKIGEFAFENCKSLTKIAIPSTVDDLGGCLFDITEQYQPDRRYKVRTIRSHNKNLTIYCYAGTKALEWARENGYPFKNAAELQ